MSHDPAGRPVDAADTTGTTGTADATGTSGVPDTADTTGAADLTDATLADRYGRTAPRGRGLRVGRRRVSAYALAITAFVVLGTAVVGWIAVDNARGAVEWKDVGFSVVSPEQIDITFDVSMAPGTTAVCSIDALSSGYAQVGHLEVPVGPNATADARYTVSVATSQEATTAVIDTCDAVDPAP
ncbi:hypothetical protein GCM10025865_20820 [Paraoerskovia sediminicola]|uniref:DUF4307 domain-containing protein n=1 Tax=Paraoerskovia sediminicola TaxID=1138587 RepID=A0ABM8G3Q4_9CELL|nr:DUF4307 domain-containing protein [Paraoerskovia sediminicola]BDZ42783.1 hypothetical protein GCM10025865_20820 [Paraoerskovia sediminicola]